MVAKSLTAIGLALDLIGVFLLVRSTAFWQETLSWGKLRPMGLKLFEMKLERRDSLWGAICVFVGFFLQFLAAVYALFDP